MITYDREKKELIIPMDFGYDCSDAIQSAHTEGYQEGLEDGKAIVRSHFGQLIKAPLHKSQLPPHMAAVYTPSGDTEAWNSVIIDYVHIYREGINDGIRSATTLPVEMIWVYNDENDTMFPYRCDSLKLNGYDVVYEYDYTTHMYWAVVNAEVSKYDVSNITAITIDFRTDIMPEESSSTMVYKAIAIDGEDAVILGYSMEYIGQASGDTRWPYVYRINYQIEPVPVSEYGGGWHDGYESGYTDGYNAERPTDSITITENGVYTNPSGGWNSVIANVHEVIPTVLLEDKVIELDYSNASGFSGDETYLPTSGYDGIGSVEVKGLSAAQHFEEVYNSAEGAYTVLNNAYTLSAKTLTINENGTYTASGETRVDYGNHTWYVPQNFKQVVVDVPVSDLCVSGSFATSADYTFSNADEQVPYIVNMPPIQCLSYLMVDGVALQSYCDNEFMLPAGSHTFWMNLGELMLFHHTPVSYNNTFPNLSGNITYSNIYKRQ